MDLHSNLLFVCMCIYKYIYIYIFVYVFIILLPMSYSSIGTSFSNNNGIEGEFVGSKPTGCITYQ